MNAKRSARRVAQQREAQHSARTRHMHDARTQRGCALHYSGHTTVHLQHSVYTVSTALSCVHSRALSVPRFRTSSPRSACRFPSLCGAAVPVASPCAFSAFGFLREHLVPLCLPADVVAALLQLDVDFRISTDLFSRPRRGTATTCRSTSTSDFLWLRVGHTFRGHIRGIWGRKLGKTADTHLCVCLHTPLRIFDTCSSFVWSQTLRSILVLFPNFAVSIFLHVRLQISEFCWVMGNSGF